jgi:hypothetical protein
VAIRFLSLRLRPAALLILLISASAARPQAQPRLDSLPLFVRTVHGTAIRFVIVHRRAPRSAPPSRSSFWTTDTTGRVLVLVPPHATSVLLDIVAPAYGRRIIRLRRDTLRSRLNVVVPFEPRRADIDCSQDWRYALHLALDSATTPDSLRVTAVAESEAFRDSISVRVADLWGGPLALAGERPGLYSVRVTAPGRTPWQRDSVRVEGDGCHVWTRTLPVRLLHR